MNFSPRIVAAGALRPLNKSLDIAERWWASRESLPEPEIFFIIGAPRSGSTLLYQLLVRALSVGYMTNAHCWFYGAPTLAERVAGRRLRSDIQRDLESEFGRTRGASGPSECGAFWYRWFRRSPQYVSDATLLSHSAQSLHDVLSLLSYNMRLPVLFKNLPCSLRLQVLAPLLPRAKFIVMTRSLFWNAQSILEARLELRRSLDNWFSLKPPNYDALCTLPAVDQAVGQVMSINEVIAHDAEAVGASRFIHVSYEDLCQDPAQEVGRLVAFLSAGLRPGVQLPAQLSRHDRERLPPSVLDALRQAVTKGQEPTT